MECGNVPGNRQAPTASSSWHRHGVRKGSAKEVASALPRGSLPLNVRAVRDSTAMKQAMSPARPPTLLQPATTSAAPRDRQPLPPSRVRGWQRYLPFNPEAIRCCVEALGSDWDDASYRHALRSHRRAKLLTYAAWTMWSLWTPTTATELEVLLFRPTLPMWVRLTGRELLLATSAVLLADRFMIRGAGQQPGFCPRIASALFYLQEMPLTGSSIVTAMKCTGSAARTLVISLQGGRTAWVESPPAVSDRSVRLARPLIDIDLTEAFDQPGQRQALAAVVSGFLFFEAAGLVVLGREDLLPGLRSLYTQVPHRRGMAEHPRVPDRDTLFLDPMGSRSRWEVIKDFALPTMAFVVSLVSLTVSLSGLALHGLRDCSTRRGGRRPSGETAPPGPRRLGPGPDSHARQSGAHLGVRRGASNRAGRPDAPGARSRGYRPPSHGRDRNPTRAQPSHDVT